MEISSNDFLDISSNIIVSDVSGDELALEPSSELDISNNDIVTFTDTSSADYTELIAATQQLNDNVVMLHNDFNLIIGIILVYIFYMFAKHIVHLLLGRK